MVTTARPLIIRQHMEMEDGFGFATLNEGRTGQPPPPPALTSILDDLDFIEAVRVGDWNGADSRREIIRHTTSGSGVSLRPPNAAATCNNAKYAEIMAMSPILGNRDSPQNTGNGHRLPLKPSFQAVAFAMKVDIQTRAVYQPFLFAYETKDTRKSGAHRLGHRLGLHGHVGILRGA